MIRAIDVFAGGGGASLGIEWATGESPIVAINHCPSAIRMHAANHPTCIHYEESVWTATPRDVCGLRAVDLAWFSPDCTHFSRAKGSKPRSKEIRSLAWVVVDWACNVRPSVICLENVPEFVTWGPLPEEGGASLRGAGWVEEATVRGRDWADCGRREAQGVLFDAGAQHPTVDKIRWRAPT